MSDTTAHTVAAMSGDDLITLVTEAASTSDAARIVRFAPAAAIREAADLLYIEVEGHSPVVVRADIVREARA